MKYKKILFIILFVISIFTSRTFAIDPPFANENITSDYSPRLLNNVFEFHDGIDYARPRDTAIPAIETGELPTVSNRSAIRRYPSGAWIFTLRENNNINTWTYMHIFSDVDPIYGNNIVTNDGRFELGVRIDPDTGRDVYFIIRNAFDGFLTKAFSNVANLEIPGRDNLYTERTVIDGEPIAPVGNSGL